MRHPINEVGKKRLCPVTGTEFNEAWTDHTLPSCYNKCDQCYPKEYKPVSQRLADLAGN